MIFVDARFETWLSSETGIDASSLGINTLTRAVNDRIRETQDVLQGDALDVYWHLLNHSADERQALVEALVVPETWFFRDREAFAALTKLATVCLASAPARVLRVLSVPCSSGEEPYSAAMALLDAGFDPSRFVIDAIDISGQAIERAQQASYGRNSFRGHALEFRARHFTEIADGWQLHERVRQSVRFARGNLFEPLQQTDTRYDFVFCRNVLIYFHRDAQDRAIRLLDAQLADGGTIFVGPAETGLMMRHAMTSARIPLAFAFYRTPPDEAENGGGVARWNAAAPGWTKPGHKPAAMPDLHDPLAELTMPAALRDAYAAAASAAALLAGKPAAISMAPALPVAPVAAAVSSAGRPALPFAAAHPAPMVASAAQVLAPQQTDLADLADAQRLADAGRFDDAERIVREFTRGHEPDADAFYLLGLIADARGRGNEAADFYRKALYLAPAHYETLTHLAALLDVSGDAAGAQQMTLRAQRAIARQAAADPGRVKSS
ncbi:CheR family methyltransferase [Paraburkholderia sp.]|uniref:CheR family methyltransferase n=1 Tax=Paraburkholderia sp. TaxID=1926495 RepID=UPI003D6DF938